MQPLQLGDFATVVGGRMTAPEPLPDTVVEHVAVHSDRVRVGSAFFALRGERTDGHRFVPEAIANGAVVAVVSEAFGEALDDAGRGLVVVDDPLRALQRLAAWCRSRLSCTVVAIAGSIGKTVTKDALVQFASYGRRTYGSPGSYNSQLGVALALVDCPADCELAVIEAAATEPGEMSRLQAMIRPDHAVFTHLGARHVSNFADHQDQAREIVGLAHQIGTEGWILLGERDPHLTAAVAGIRPGRSLVVNDSEELPRFSPPRYSRTGLVVRADFADGNSGDLSIATPSEDVLADVELAISACWLLGLPARRLLEAAGDYQPASTRTEIWHAPNGVVLIRDVATTDSIATGSALRTARRLLGSGGRAVVVLAAPLAPHDEPAIRELGRVIGVQADLVYALDTPTHRTLAESLTVANPTVWVQFFGELTALRGALVEDVKSGDVVLVQSLPNSAIADLAQDLVEAMAPTRLYLDQSAIESNVRTFRKLIGPSTRMMGVVKALAYGTNPAQLSRCLEAAGVDALGVATADEGVALRRSGINLPVLVMLGTSSEVEKMLRHRLTPLVYSPDILEAVLAEGLTSELPVSIHLEVDSGMHRTGFDPDASIAALRRLSTVSTIRLDGIMTHLACADDPSKDDVTRLQLARYERVVAAARELGFDGFIRHAAATAATVRFPEARLDMVRVGIGLYGLWPSAVRPDLVGLTPAISLVSRIVEVHDVPAGEGVGYGATYAAPAAGSRIGVVPAGYHDCIPRAFSNFGSVIVDGTTCPIVGTVSMDSMTIDLSSSPTGDVGSDVLIYGRHGGSLVPMEEVADVIGTIAHELLARVGPRVQRVFTHH
jgi:alanine racemase